MNSKTDVIVFCFAILTGFSAVDARAVPAEPVVVDEGDNFCDGNIRIGYDYQMGVLNRSSSPGDTGAELTEIKKDVLEKARKYYQEKREKLDCQVTYEDVSEQVDAKVWRLFDGQERKYYEVNGMPQAGSAPIYLMDRQDGYNADPPQYLVEAWVEGLFCCSPQGTSSAP